MLKEERTWNHKKSSVKMRESRERVETESVGRRKGIKEQGQWIGNSHEYGRYKCNYKKNHLEHGWSKYTN